MLDIATDRLNEEGILVVQLRGRLDAITAREFQTFFDEVLKGGHRFIVARAGQLDFVSSAGIAALLGLARRLGASGGALAFAELNPEVRLLLRFFGLEQVLPQFDTLDDARAHFAAALRAGRFSLELERERVIRTPVASSAPASAASTASQSATGSTSASASTAAPAARSAAASGPADRVRRVDDSRRAELQSARRATAVQLRRGARSEVPAREDEALDDAIPTAAAEPLPDATPAPETDAPRSRQRESFQEIRRADAAKRLPARPSAPRPDSDETADVQRDAARRGRGAGFSVREAPAAESRFEQPRVLACEQCGASLRVYRPGLYLCPECAVEFQVSRDGGASFFEKL